MKTIPTAWKAGTTDRNLWYNNRGTPLILCKITLITGSVVRVANRDCSFSEAGTSYNYSADYFQGLGAIDFAINFLEGMAGATGQMSGTMLTLSNAERNGKRFTDLWYMDNFDNATIEIYYLPYEAGTLITTNALQIYKGVITNFMVAGDRIELTINDYSNTKHKKIPVRIDEYNAANSCGWVIPEASKGKVIPFCFGTGMYKAIHMDTDAGSPLYHWVGYHQPETRTARQLKLYYWDPERKFFNMVTGNLFTEALNTIYMARFKLEDFPVLAGEVINYIRPFQASFPSSWLVNHAKLHDGVKALDADGAYVNPLQLVGLEDTWVLVSQVSFWKKEFEGSSNFDLYLCSEANYGDYVNPPASSWGLRFTVQVINTIETIAYDAAKWIDGGAGGYKYYCEIDQAYLNEGWTPALDGYLMKAIMSMEDFSDSGSVVIVNVEAYKKSGPPEIALYLRELALKQVMLALPRDFYVKDNFGNNAIEDALSWVFASHLNISAANVEYVNFGTGYKIDGQQHEEIDSYDFFAKIAKEFGVIFYETEEGKERFINIAAADDVYEIADADVLTDDAGQLQITVTKNVAEIATSFYVDYRKNLATGEYEGTRYVTKDNHNLTFEDPAALKFLCKYAYQKYSTEKRMSVQLDFVRDDETAERILGKLVNFYCRRRFVVSFMSRWRLIDLELGDQVRINTTVFAHGKNFYVAGKHVDPVNFEIEWILFETPWADSGRQEIKNETEALTETVVKSNV